jgi:NADP-dependent 3-hydroxy acid dehydrogenase YdfG
VRRPIGLATARLFTDEGASVIVVGRNHDHVQPAVDSIGQRAAYAWAAGHPDEVRAVALMEAFPAGLEPPQPLPDAAGQVDLAPGLPEHARSARRAAGQSRTCAPRLLLLGRSV